MEELLLGRYRILSKIGEGASGKVFKAFDNKIGREVAIKEIPATPVTAPRVLRELRTIANLNHPNIVTVYEFEETEKNYYIIMEFLDGITLRQILKKQPLTLSQILAIAIQVCDALDYAHSFEIIHRDIKPENIMVLKDGRVKLTDFGIARLISRSIHERRIVGTLGYMSPEQVTGRFVDETTDIFSTGVVLYEMLTGKNPLFAETLKETAMKILNLNPPPPSTINPSIPQELDSLILKSIAKDPDTRFQTAREFREKLEDFQIKSGSFEDILKPVIEIFPGEEVVLKEERTPFEEMRLSVSKFLRKRERLLKNLFLAISLALISFTGLPKTAFYPKELNYLIPATLFSISLFYPIAALWLTAASFLPPLFSQSLLYGILGTFLLFLYCAIFTEEEPSWAALPFLSFPFSSLKLDFFFPFLIGLICSPGIAFLLGAFGILFTEIFDLRLAQTLRYIPLKNNFLGYPKLNPQMSIFESFKVLIKPFIKEPLLWSQILLWALAAALISLPATIMKRRWLGRLVGVILGISLLVGGYYLIFSFLKITPFPWRKIVKRLLLPITLAFLLIPILEVKK